MTDHPIIFSSPMVLALLAGRKFQTRRLAWLRKENDEWRANRGFRRPYPRAHHWEVPTPWQRVKPGDRMWVRETFCPCVASSTPGPTSDAKYVVFKDGGQAYRDGDQIAPLAKYAAGAFSICDGHWKPSIHIPRWASRLTLTVTATKIEPLQDISEADTIAEGIQGPNESGLYFIAGVPGASNTAQDRFRMLFESLNGPEIWKANPEVVALTFTVAKHNIDHA